VDSVKRTLNLGPEVHGFLTGQRLRQALIAERLVSFPDVATAAAIDGAVKRGQGASLELRLGDEYYVTGQDAPRYLCDGDDTLVIPGGQFALLTTYETVDIPTNCFALISVKFSSKKQGLINVSGFHVDPGYEGRIHYAVFNAGPANIYIRWKQPLFQLFLYQMSEAVEGEYLRSAKGLDKLALEDVASIQGRSLSLFEMEKEVESLKSQLKIAIGLAVGVLVALIPLVIQALRVVKP
jgi:dCTP deaminase